jgi:hypothetical protein
MNEMLRKIDWEERMEEERKVRKNGRRIEDRTEEKSIV